MRLLVLSNRYPPHIKGGYELVCYEVIERLKERGHEAFVLTGLFGVEAPEERDGVRRALRRMDDSPDPLTLGRWEIADNRALREAAQSFKPDLIFIWNLEELFPSLNLTAGELGVPVVYSLHDIWLLRSFESHRKWRSFWEQPGSSLARRLPKQGARMVLRTMDRSWLRPFEIADVDGRHFAFVSEFRKREHVAAGLPVAASPVIYNGIDLSRFPSPTGDGASGPVRFLFAGRLDEAKGVHTLVEAARLLAARRPDGWEVSIYGIPERPHSYGEALERAIESEGLASRVRFEAPVSNDEMPAVYARHDVFVFPSIGTEGFPLSLIEAMASGLAVVGTTTGGSAEILRDGENSLTFPPDDAAALAGCMERLVDDSTVRAEIAATGKRLVFERFTTAQMLDETERYLVEICSGRRGKG